MYYRKYFDDYWWFHESLLRIVRARRLEISNSPKEQDLKADMLTCLINSGLKTDDGRSTTDEEIVFMMKDYLSEGIGTVNYQNLSFLQITFFYKNIKIFFSLPLHLV